MTKTYAELVERGCLCGTDRSFHCPLHGPGDNRGLAAFFRAGMPGAFPSSITCGRCGSEALMYPDWGEDEGAPAQHRPTTVCPECSSPAVESWIRFKVEEQGVHQLNSSCVFTTATRLKVESSESSHLGFPEAGWEPITDPDELQRSVLAHFEREACA
jgi:hypothetical protein